VEQVDAVLISQMVMESRAGQNGLQSQSELLWPSSTKRWSSCTSSAFSPGLVVVGGRSLKGKERQAVLVAVKGKRRKVQTVTTCVLTQAPSVTLSSSCISVPRLIICKNGKSQHYLTSAGTGRSVGTGGVVR